MSLALENITKEVGRETHLYDISLEFEPGSRNVLLGRTLAGKTSLLRLMAGLDRPTTGRVLVNGEDVTGKSVRKRSVAMVYQQFINYPSLTVYKNIASPLKIAGVKKGEIDRRVRKTAEMLHIEDMLDRLPTELSGGQQQRVAIARALIGDAELLLLDEPLVNLDYKLREELRVELHDIFEEREAIVVYTTTEPTEALMLGGNILVMDEGRILQTGSTPEVYHNPATTKVAEVFSDPPINFLNGTIQGGSVRMGRNIEIPLEDYMKQLSDGDYTFGVRSNHLFSSRNDREDEEIPARVELAEINGSETFIHADYDGCRLVVQETGVRPVQIGAEITIYVSPCCFFVYDGAGALVASPSREALQSGLTQETVMARIELNEVVHSYLPKPKSESDYALKRIHNVWDDGGACALLGPSGCGKTTLLNIVSGLLTPSRGRVLYDGKDVTELPPEKRNIAQVFQFPVLYDTMSVFNNLAFPLRNRGISESKLKERVLEVAEILDLTPFLNKRAAGLAADAKQKISLGRGLVRSDVAAILFDEPLTVIDPQMKWYLRQKLKDIHEELKLTFIYVTHDQVEALTFADQVAVMFEGEIVQIGSPQDLFENPEHRFVGYFIGSPGMNFLECTIEGNEARVDGAGIVLNEETAAKGRKAGGKLELGIRPMYLEVHAGSGDGMVKANVKGVEDLGSYRIMTLALAGQTLKARLAEDKLISGDEVWLGFPPQWIRLFADGRLIK